MEKAAKVAVEIENFYLHKNATNDSPYDDGEEFYLQRYSQLLSDLQFVVPIVWEGRLKSQMRWPLFLYTHAYVNEASAFPPGYIGPRLAYHGIDHDFLFGVRISQFVRAGL